MTKLLIESVSTVAKSPLAKKNPLIIHLLRDRLFALLNIWLKVLTGICLSLVIYALYRFIEYLQEKRERERRQNSNFNTWSRSETPDGWQDLWNS